MSIIPSSAPAEIAPQASTEDDPWTLVYVSGARDDADCLAVAEALVAAGVGNVDIYRPSCKGLAALRADAEALASSALVVQWNPVKDRTAADGIVSLTAYGLRIPEVYVGDILVS